MTILRPCMPVCSCGIEPATSLVQTLSEMVLVRTSVGLIMVKFTHTLRFRSEVTISSHRGLIAQRAPLMDVNSWRSRVVTVLSDAHVFILLGLLDRVGVESSSLRFVGWRATFSW